MKTRTELSVWTRLLGLICVIGLVTQVTLAQANITVQVDKPGAPVPKTLFGLFFEDINFGADGGLYPERVKNRSFQFPNPMMGWTQVDRGDIKGQLYVFDQGSVKDTANSHYLRIKVPVGSTGSGIMNEGFRGIGVEKGADYTFSIMVRKIEGPASSLRVEIDEGGRSLGHAQLSNFTKDWKTYTTTLRATDTSSKARLTLILE